MSLNTLQERCHLATSSGTINSLYSEVTGYYLSGNLFFIVGNKYIKELRKRKLVNFNDSNVSGLNYLDNLSSGTGTPETYYYLMENGTDVFLMENGTDKWLIEY